MRLLGTLQRRLNAWHEIERRAADLCELAALTDHVEQDDAEAVLADVQRDVAAVLITIDDFESDGRAVNPNDRRPALLIFNSGAGGQDAQDWAGLLLRMYLRWADFWGREIALLDIARSAEGGVRSATVRIGGDQAYSLLESEHGVHRLVRVSPFSRGGTRHSSFASVDVIPDIGDDLTTAQIAPSDIRVDTFKAGGNGGQNVQKNDTAVRLTHLPTGLSATCQNERSQHRNRESALLVLRSRVAVHDQQRRDAKRAERSAARGDAATRRGVTTSVTRTVQTCCS